jgi:hypothetical protein
MSTETHTADASAFDRGYNFLRVTNEHAQMGTDPTETAVYKYDTTTGNWNLVTSETGDANGIREALLNVSPAPVLNTERIVHLRPGGEWMPVVPDHLMQPSTARQRIEAEIADLRAEAHRISEAAAYSGSYGSGAGLLETRADAMQHVLDLFAADND